MNQEKINPKTAEKLRQMAIAASKRQSEPLTTQDKVRLAAAASTQTTGAQQKV